MIIIEDKAVKAHINQVVRGARTSFYWAMRLQPSEKREALFSVYAFCREVDDIADEAGTVDEKTTALNQWRKAVEELNSATSDYLTVRALAFVAKKYPLKKKDFLDVIDGMEMDARGPIVAPDRATFDLYIDRVACAVGRCCNPVFGVTGDISDKLAYHLGRALQITNILRDVREDADIGRLYLPSDVLIAAGIPVTTPHDILAHGKIKQVLSALASDAESEFSAAKTLIDDLETKTAKPLRLMHEVYYMTLQNLYQVGWDAVLEGAHRSGFSRFREKVNKGFIALRYGMF